MNGLNSCIGRNWEHGFHFFDNTICFFFQSEDIFVQLHELDELDRIIHAGIDSITVSNCHRKHSSVTVRVVVSQASDLGSIIDQVFKFFENFILFNLPT